MSHQPDDFWAPLGPAVKPSMQEWLETDGLGGFASQTTSGINTRRYHGLLFMSAKDPGDRYLALTKLEDSCQDGDGRYDLSSNFYPGARHPGGADNLLSFERYPFPRFVYKVGHRTLAKEIFMVGGEKGVYCVYSLLQSGGSPMTLRIRPLCGFRPYHHINRDTTWNPSVSALSARGECDGAVAIGPHPACGMLHIACYPSEFQEGSVWYRDMLYPNEAERGLEYLENHFSPGEFEAPVAYGVDVVVWAGPSGDKAPSGENLRKTAHLARSREERRRRSISAGMTPLGAKLALASDQFIVSPEAGKSIIAGYHWFGEWGRDTFIALPGLVLEQGRFEDAKEIFLRFAAAMEGGLIPNRFEEGEGASYNTVDGPLWMIRALLEYEKTSGDRGFVRHMLPRIREVVDSFLRGTRFSIGATPSGLLLSGDSGTQLTWMDAKVGCEPVTPRDGFAVEINALWIAALSALASWEERLGSHPHSGYQNVAASALAEFRRLFLWQGVGLYDRVGEEGPVPEIRPNQIIAANLLAGELGREALVDVYRTATSSLLTPRGLRTLAPGSPGYAGHYGGGPSERDRAYHQGTAWPFLSWQYCELASNLYREPGGKVSPLLMEAVKRASTGILNLDENLCVGSVFEVASGDAPHQMGGAIAQAWSVAAAIKMARLLEKEGEGTC